MNVVYGFSGLLENFRISVLVLSVDEGIDKLLDIVLDALNVEMLGVKSFLNKLLLHEVDILHVND